MQSITAEGIEETIEAAPSFARPRWRPFAGLVLPRFLRRPARMLKNADFRLPRYLGTKSVALLFLATVVAGAIIGGHQTDVLAAFTAGSGLGIDAVRITGQSRTEELDVLDKLNIGPFPSLLTFDLEAAKARIETLPWVAEATLRKLYPHDLNVVIREREPRAIWQDGDKLWLIDGSGHTITDAVDDRYAGLPVVAGVGAATRYGEFTALLAQAPAIAAKTRAGVLIGARRWTLLLDNGIELMLPEENAGAALATVAELDAGNALLSREIAAVDLRAPDRVVVRLDADGSAARTAFLKARAKLVKAKTG